MIFILLDGIDFCVGQIRVYEGDGNKNQSGAHFVSFHCGQNSK